MTISIPLVFPQKRDDFERALHFSCDGVLAGIAWWDNEAATSTKKKRHISYIERFSFLMGDRILAGVFLGASKGRDKISLNFFLCLLSMAGLAERVSV